MLRFFGFFVLVYHYARMAIGGGRYFVILVDQDSHHTWTDVREMSAELIAGQSRAAIDNLIERNLVRIRMSEREKEEYTPWFMRQK